MPLLRDEFLVYVKGQPTRDWMYYWVAQRHIWKLRLTRVGIDPPAAFPEELLTAAAALSVANEPH